MSVETFSYRGYAFVAGELASRHGGLMDDEAQAFATAMAQAAVVYLLVHFGVAAANAAVQALRAGVPPVLGEQSPSS